MTDRRRAYTFSVMTAKTIGTSPDKRRKYDEAFTAEVLRLASESRSTQAAARQLGISPKLLYYWQQAQLVAEAGSVKVTRDPKVRALRPPQAGGAGARYFKKKPWSSSASRRGEHLPAHRPARRPRARAPALPSAGCSPGCVPRLAAPPTAATGRARLASSRTRSVFLS